MTCYNPSIDCEALQKYGKITNPVQYLQEIYMSILYRNGYPYISNARALYREGGYLSLAGVRPYCPCICNDWQQYYLKVDPLQEQQ